MIKTLSLPMPPGVPAKGFSPLSNAKNDNNNNENVIAFDKIASVPTGKPYLSRRSPGFDFNSCWKPTFDISKMNSWIRGNGASPFQSTPSGCIVAFNKGGAVSFSIRTDEGEQSRTSSDGDPISNLRKAFAEDGSPASAAASSFGEKHSCKSHKSSPSSFRRKRSASVCLGNPSSCSLDTNDTYPRNILWTLSYVKEEREYPEDRNLSNQEHEEKMKVYRGEYSMDEIRLTKNVPENERTTVMIRNIPNRYDRESILGLLWEYQYAEKVDFIYIPIDFRSDSNMGYCFVNFPSSEDARQFKTMSKDFSSWKYNSTKKCDVQWAKPYQGLAAHIHRFRNSPMMHESVRDDHKPLLLLNGESVPFPKPSVHLSAPQIRRAIQRQRKRKRVNKAE